MIAAAGPLRDRGLEHPSAAFDRRVIKLWCPESWPVEAWELLVEDRARKLVRTEAFSNVWRALVVTIERQIGEAFVELDEHGVDAPVSDALELVEAHA